MAGKASEKLIEKAVPIWKTYKSGITRNSILAILYAMLVFTPAQIYLSLMTGGGVEDVAWFTLLMCLEFARLSGTRITKQEAFFIFTFAGVASAPIGLIQMAWFRQSDLARKLGIAYMMPDWAAPPPEARILELRTFFHPAWLPVIGVDLIAGVFTLCLELGLNLFAREVFIEVERLPFPMQQMTGQGLIVLTEGGKSQMYIFALSAILSFGYSLLLYTVPAITNVPLIPVPFIDLTSIIEPIFPGAILGIGTTLASFTLGWFIPFRLVLGMFIAAVIIGIFGNWLSVIYQWVPDTDPRLPGYQSWWLPGMDLPTIMARSTLYFWTSIFLGAGFALGIAPIITHPHRFVQAIKSVVKPISVAVRPVEERIIEPISFYKVILPLIVIGMSGSVLLFCVLAPGFLAMFPWILPTIILLPFLNTMISGRLMGTVGQSFTLTQFADIAYWSAQITYPGLEQWFVPNPMGVTGDAATFKVCQLMEVRDIDYIKMSLILWPVSLIVGYLYLQAFWAIAPIPSPRWPATVIYWPRWASEFSATIRGLQYNLLHIDWLIYSFIIFLVLYVLLDIIHSPIPYIAIAGGIGLDLPNLITGLIGSVFAHMIRVRMGDEWWYENRYTIGAGIATGTAIAVTIAVAAAMIMNSIWVLPF